MYAIGLLPAMYSIVFFCVTNIILTRNFIMLCIKKKKLISPLLFTFLFKYIFILFQLNLNRNRLNNCFLFYFSSLFFLFYYYYKTLLNRCFLNILAFKSWWDGTLNIYRLRHLCWVIVCIKVNLFLTKI